MLLFTNGKLVDRISARLKQGSGVACVQRAVNRKFKRSKRKKGTEDRLLETSESILTNQDDWRWNCPFGLIGEGSSGRVYKDAEEQSKKGVTQQEQKL
ncbi:MAG: hypothetical protein WA672_06810 [Candidatus Angelobacter sp.]